jgi:hypothetical protein
MNILVDKLPYAVEIDGKSYLLNTDFRFCVRIILAFEDEELTGYEKQLIMLANLYPVLPDNIEAAVEKATWFLNGDNPTDEQNELSLRLYSFSRDANFIFAAFRQTHGIDLENAQMHWWKFMALFMDLGADTTFCNLVSLRKRIKTGKATKEEKITARELGDLVELKEPDTRTLEEREAEDKFMRQLQGVKV